MHLAITEPSITFPGTILHHQPTLTMPDISRTKHVITGHNREATDRVAHFIRLHVEEGQPAEGRPGSAGTIGPIYTDDAGILPDGTIIEVATTYEIVS